MSWIAPDIDSRRKLEHRRDLLRELVTRDMKLRYKRSYLGVAWTLVNPLMQLVVFDFVFSVIFRTNTPYFTLYLFIGITSWNWFNNALIEGTGAILYNKAMISQPGFPSVLLPNVTVSSTLLHFLLTLPIVFALVLYEGLPITGAVVWLPLIILVQYCFTVSLVLLTACLHVNFRDTQYLLSIFLMLGFFLTPILYDVSLVPERYQLAYALNPMTQLIDAYRAVLMRGTAPSAAPLATVAALSLVQLGAFSWLFQRASASFAEQL